MSKCVQGAEIKMSLNSEKKKVYSFKNPSLVPNIIVLFFPVTFLLFSFIDTLITLYPVQSFEVSANIPQEVRIGKF